MIIEPTLKAVGQMEEETYSSPERRLLIGMLERALRDLMTGSYLEMNSAIEWFTHRRLEHRDYTFIPYRLVREELELGDNVLRQIKKMLDTALERKKRILSEAHIDRFKKAHCVVPNEFMIKQRDGKLSYKFKRIKVSLS